MSVEQALILIVDDDAELAAMLVRLFSREHWATQTVLTAGDADGVPYFTMPLVEGPTLRERMVRAPVPHGEAVGILRDVARALAVAHAKGVVHRDIKPENILLSAGAALVTDFGVAKAMSLATEGSGTAANMTALGVAIGTPAYMAPEQLAADPGLDHRADLYAWGMVAYELLGGVRPFADLSGTPLLHAQMRALPEALHTRAPTVPMPLAALVTRCLAKAPSERPASAAELLAVLDQPSGDRSAAPVADRTRVTAPARWWLLAGVGLGALALAGW